MIRSLSVIAILLFQVSAFAAEKVEYIADSIAQKDGKYIKLLGGSSWLLNSSSLALVTQDVIVVFRSIVGKDKKTYEVPVFYLDSEEIIAKHIDGALVKESGFLAQVVQQFGEGARLKLDDGTILSIPEYDRYDTGWWLPPYQALVTGNGLYMWNLEKGKRVWVEGIQ
ncbi:TPA: hypothetical protein L5Q58_006307 [Pseudomonas aeruginosa]|jgi:hypothetical protein|nr:hypothetical protein [Pseudomonas aeruginosa]RRV69556.1 hypothetical protein EGI99_05770 [Stutzerimonas stutzeri]HBP0677562.1 hypothetical protein [Pseudomonas aeruginosa]HBP0703205.1 hypothetical protein [Pseudomonas aeruginosa]HCT5055357.1 hypothetical protein [Pseudomonas aeruginosa]